ncbi:DUF1080 domain-containing protein [Pricia sp. S334]|uniref:DUF1080 domain-containing protein n=1 Tax=Pricia mediterranea TaxID=3076079 RepID=A0ABU3L309_9FLAO|nr:DUF1080 domain-containing protein [Pricia sp. S334]MDT7828015.1 DUF1080 domain-containing protein [Pricia sp. S334]
MKKMILYVAMALIMPNAMFSQNNLASKEGQNGWKQLFNGKNMKGWTATDGSPVSDGWQVIDGSIVAIQDGKGGDIMTVGEYSNFDLSIEYKIEPGVNSGVKYFFTRYKNGGQLGMEYQIIDDEEGEDINQSDHLTGSFYDVLPPDESKKSINPPGQWNTLRILSNGKKVEHRLNGVKILSYKRGSNRYKKAVTKSKFNEAEPAFGMVEKGHIMLQEHGGVVAFKNIKIKELK